MAFELMELPYAKNALEPYISKRTIDFHYGKHHKKYVDRVNKLIKGTPQESQSLEEIMYSTYKKNDKIYNNAAQIWNHTFYWNCLTPNGRAISNSVKNVIEKHFMSLQKFMALFTEQALELFGTGWTWLVIDKKGEIKIRAIEDAGNPLLEREVPLLTCDVWEHAYYLDYQNDRERYIENFWQIVNWEFVEENFGKTMEYPFRRTQSHEQGRPSPKRKEVRLF
ncbi:MAG: superoxide dismutase [Bdellovibrionales bacterium]|nr:superoxide dismutase [Bdellovibrionales bacterium]